MKFPSLVSVVLLVLAVGMAVFFWKSNDHQECSTLTKTITNEQGSTVTIQEHQCQERFSI